MVACQVRHRTSSGELFFTGEHTDPRTYRVSFKRILTELKDYYKPEWSLIMGGKELVEMFDRIGFTEKQFRGKESIRLQQLTYLKEEKKMDESFRLV